MGRRRDGPVGQRRASKLSAVYSGVAMLPQEIKGAWDYAWIAVLLTQPTFELVAGFSS